ncbi:MAG: YjgN family protein [Cytophagales bacterium]|nr:YjgN family protein [Cytophagales bacterium]
MTELFQPEQAPIGNTAPNKLQLQFTGKGGEYFRIWIVNLTLTILTLGIYSAWAKVRRVQYFYRNTQLAGSGFQFHGSPVAILKGRVIAIVALIAYSRLGDMSSLFATIVAAILVLVVPWLVQSALRFRNYNASYRGIRFRFNGLLRESYITIAPMLLAFMVPTLIFIYTDAIDLIQTGKAGLLTSLGVLPLVLWPYFHWRQRRFFTDGSSFGNAAFSLRATAGNFYGLYLKFLAIYAGTMVLIVIASIPIIFVFASKATSMMTSTGGIIASVLIGIVVLVVVFSTLSPYFISRMQNLVWSNTSLGGQPFHSTATLGGIFKIQIVNTLLTLITLGLYRPYAVIRMMKYRLECVSWTGEPDHFANILNSANTSAAGQETADFLGIDLGL